MVIKIDFNSDEAIYIQLRNQIIMGIATSQLAVGDSLPSVRQLADYVGINMHTVNKAYSVLRQEGYIKLDRRKGAVIAIDYALMVLMSSSLEKLPSEPKGKVRIRKNRRASTPNFSARIYGSTTLPLDLDILPPSSSSQPWP